MKRLSTTDFAALDELLEHEVHADRGVDGLETIRRLYPKLRQLREQGVPFRQLLELLKRQGLELSASTLHRYLKRIDKERRRVAREQKPSAASPAARSHEVASAPTPAASTPRPPASLSLARKAPSSHASNAKGDERAPATAGHFTPAPDSDRI